MRPRPYQAEAIRSALEDLKTYKQVWIQSACGTGKTHMYSGIAAPFLEQGYRIIMLAHRDELIEQGMNKLRQITKTHVAKEKGESWVTEVGPVMPIIVSSHQTMNTKLRREKLRMHKFNNERPWLVISDECHHDLAPTHKRTIDWFTQHPLSKLVGFTATPKRGDRQSLARVYQKRSFCYTAGQAIDDGWLVDVDIQRTILKELNVDAIGVSCGDLSGAQLDAQMKFEKVAAPVAEAALRGSLGLKALVFAPGIDTANRVTEIINSWEKGAARCVTSKSFDRTEVIQGFRYDEFRILVNVGILGEGADFPDIGCIVMARPTLSPSNYEQWISRGMRPLPHVVDGLDEELPLIEQTPNYAAELRKAAIAFSDKPLCRVLDCCGISERHELVTAADVFIDSGVDPKILSMARAMNGPVRENVKRMVADRDAEEARRRARLKTEVKMEYVPSTGVKHGGKKLSRGSSAPISEWNVAKLSRWKIPTEGLTDGQARAIKDAVMTRLAKFGGYDKPGAWQHAVAPFKKNALNGLAYCRQVCQ